MSIHHLRMINKINKYILIVSCIFLVSNCSGNRFKDGEMLNTFTFGITGYDSFKFCKKIDPYFILYKNGVNPRRTCIHYGYYKCHIEHYCKGDKDCEKDAQRYWIKEWKDKYGNWTDPVNATKTYCERIKKQCNSAKKGDQTCRR